MATAICLQLAACVPNFMIQEHFLPFNEPWTNEFVTWTPRLDAHGALELPTAPGLGLDLVLDAIRAHPYRRGLHFNAGTPGWEKRLSRAARADEAAIP